MTDDSAEYSTLLTQTRQKMFDQKAELEERLSRLNQALEHVEKALECTSGHEEVINPTPPRLIRRRRRAHSGALLPLVLSNMTLEEALIEFASRSGGFLNSYDVRPILIEAGLLKGSPGTASSRLYEALSNSDHFEQIEGERKGRWKMVTNDVDDDDSPI